MRATRSILAAVAVAISFAFASPALADAKMQEQMFSPSVQIDENCSGTIVYSKRDDKTGKVETLILTAKHCLTGADREYRVKVPVYQNNVIVKHDSFVATVKGVSYKADLGLLVLRDTQTFFDKPAKLAGADVAISMGDPVWTVGYPLGLALTVTEGLFGSVESLVMQGKTGQYYRATPNAAPGNSGGALYHKNAAGDYELIGVTSAGVMQFFFMIFYTPAADIADYLKIALPAAPAIAGKST